MVMNKALDCHHSAAGSPMSFWHLLGRIWRRATYSNRLDPNGLSTHMLRDLGLPSHSGEDPLARDRLRNFF
jgi:hypothetical protein